MQSDDGTAASSNTSKDKSAEKERKHRDGSKKHKKKGSTKKSKAESKSKSKKSKGSKGKTRVSSKKHKRKGESGKESKSKSVKEGAEKSTRKSKDKREAKSVAETSASGSRRRKHRRKSSKHAAPPSSTSSRRKKKTSVFRKIYRKLAGPKKKKGRRGKSRKKAEEQISPTKRSEAESKRPSKKTRTETTDETRSASHGKDREVVAVTEPTEKKKETDEIGKVGAPGTAEVTFSDDQAAKTTTVKVENVGMASSTAESTTEATEQKELPEVVPSPEESTTTESKPMAPEGSGEVNRQASEESTRKEEAMSAPLDNTKHATTPGAMGTQKKLYHQKPLSAVPSEESIITPERIPIKDEKRKSAETEPRITSFICPETRYKHEGVVAVDWQSLQGVLLPEY